MIKAEAETVRKTEEAKSIRSAAYFPTLFPSMREIKETI